MRAYLCSRSSDNFPFSIFHFPFSIFNFPLKKSPEDCENLPGKNMLLLQDYCLLVTESISVMESTIWVLNDITTNHQEVDRRLAGFESIIDEFVILISVVHDINTPLRLCISVCFEADGYTKTKWGIDIVNNANQYNELIYNGFKSGEPPIYFLMIGGNIIKNSNGAFHNGYGFRDQ